MKIGVNALFLIPGEVGGSETYLRQTLRAAAAKFKEHEFIVFSNRENIRILAMELRPFKNVSIVDMRLHATSRIRRVMCEQTALPRAVEAASVDVLWNPSFSSPYRVKCPQVTTVYDMQYVHFPEDFSPFERFCIRFGTHSSLARATLILTISEFSRREIAQHARVQFSKIRVTPLAADESFSKRLPGEFIAERIISLTRSADPYILVVSNTYPHKNVEASINAFGELAASIPHKLVIVGKPRRGEPAVKNALNSLPKDVSSRVIRLYEVAKPDLVALYQGCALFLFPSRYEGFGLPVLEALHAGAPVITTREASIPEVGGNAVNYVPVDEPETLVETIRNVLSPHYERISFPPPEFSWEQTAQATIDALEEAVVALSTDSDEITTSQT
jgi:glycosyltransferase involved in cell wall biosynthesis